MCEIKLKSVYAGLKSEETNKRFIVDNNDVRDDLQLLTLFVLCVVCRGKNNQNPGTCVYLLLLIHVCYQIDMIYVSICTRFEH